MSAFMWCRIPETSGTQIEAINNVDLELEIAKEYLGGELDDTIAHQVSCTYLMRKV
jgi:hypothetical protein